MRFRFYAFVMLSCLALPARAQTQDQTDGSLHVLRPSIDTEQDAAEICLEFDHPLDLTDRAHLLAGIRLTMDGKAVQGLSSNVNATGSFLCLQALEHRRKYDLAIANLHGAKGEKLPGPYTLSFTVPDRHPTLAFAGDASGGGLMRYRDNEPVLRAINIPRVRIELYRLTDPAAFADAYRQRLQTSLAPSESLAFARSNGQLVWQGEMVLDNGDDDSSANRTIEQTIPLRAAAGVLNSGLYFIVAIAPKPTHRAKIKPEDVELAPSAAEWFLRSNLKLRVISGREGFYAEAENADGTASIKDVHLAVSDRNRQVLAEGQTDAGGIAFLPVAGDKRDDAETLTGTAPGGDIDFADLTQPAADLPAPPDFETTLTADRPFYRPGSTAHFTLGIRDIHDKAVAIGGSTLKLMRPDKAFYASIPVPDAEAGIAYASFSVPVAEGIWSVSWQQNNGHVLAEVPLRISSNKNAPHIEIAASRPSPGDNVVTVTLHSLTDDGKPEPYIAGHVLVRWSAPDTLAGWNNYKFGPGENNDSPATPVAAFITDGNGAVSLPIDLKRPKDRASLHTALIGVRTDPASGVADPDPLPLPLNPDRYVIGLKPLALDGKFAENSLARFDVIALDGEGKRQTIDGLSYQIYEEGRSFAWYQADGRWEYKPQQQRRRIGGGALVIKTGGTTVSWPVTAGSYTVEISDAAGTILARAQAHAGWGLSKPESSQISDLILKPAAQTAQTGIPLRIAFTLDKPSMISAVVADDRIRKVIHQTMPAGDNAIDIAPEESWGARIGIRIEAQSGSSSAAGEITLPVRHNPKELVLVTSMPAHVAAGQELVLPVSVANIASSQPTFVSAIATPMPDAGDARDDAPESIVVKGVATDRDGRTVLHMTAPSFSGTLRLKIMAANQDQKGLKELLIPVRPAFAADFPAPSILHAEDTTTVSLALRNNDLPAGAFRYGVTASSGIEVTGVLKGSVTLAPGQAKIIPLTLHAAQVGAQEIKIEIFGAHNFRDARTWPVSVVNAARTFHDETAEQLMPQQSWSLPATANVQAAGQNGLLFISMQPLMNLPQLLQELLDTEPFTTGEMAGWLEASRLWHDIIVQSDLLSETALAAQREQILFRLMRRQKQDGSFPDAPGGDSDMASTGRALVALAHADRPVAHPAADLAAEWLRQRLQNSWFEEQERPARAAGFAALAAADKLDISTLRYFAETSADKTLPPLAMAQLANALIKSGDQDKASFWLKALRDAENAKDATPPTPALLATLTDNSLFDPRELVPTMQKLSDDTTKHQTRSPASLASLLHALWSLNDRDGNWRMTIDDRERNAKGVIVVALPEKPAPVTIRNPLDKPLFIMRSEAGKNNERAATDFGVRRRIFRTDGVEIMDGRLEHNGTYIIDLEGSWPQNAGANGGASFFIHDAPGNGLRTIGCAIDGEAGSMEAWAWLRNLSLTPSPVCEPTRRGTDTVVVMPQDAANGSWRIAYLVQAEHAGSFVPASTILRVPFNQEWQEWGLQETTPAVIEIK
jgi:uncharacterized protein YfaS (alpha-2-macroglobulin family)